VSLSFDPLKSCSLTKRSHLLFFNDPPLIPFRSSHFSSSRAARLFFVKTTIMRTLISPYVHLALATSSALAAPLASERDDGSGNSLTSPSYPSLFDSPFATVSLPNSSPSSSQLLNRQGLELGPGPELSRLQINQANPDNTLTNDCNSNKMTDAFTNKSLLEGPGPSVQALKRYVQNVMRRRSKSSSNIFERDGADTPPTPNDVFSHYFRQALAGTKRSTSPIVNRDVN
jgi:hypothetical protein